MRSFKQSQPLMFKKGIYLLLLLLLFLFSAMGQELSRVREKLDNVLSQDKFQYEQGSGQALNQREDWWTVLEKWLMDFLTRWRALGWAGFLILLAAGSLIMAFALWLVRQWRYQKNPAVRGGKGSGVLGKETRDYQRLFLDAELLARRREYKKAIEQIMKSIWLYCNSRKILAYRTSKTNREFLAEFSDQKLLPLLRLLVEKGESAVYGRENTNREDYQFVRKNAEALFSL